MRRSLYLVVIASLLLELLAPALQPSVAYAAGDDGANAIAGGLGGLAHKLDELAYVEALGDLLPLTATSVSDDLGLALSHLFGDTLGIIDSSPGSLSALEAAILTASGNVAGTEIAFSDVVSSTAGSVTHLSFSVNAAHVDSLIPVAYYTDTVPLDLYGGGITTTFELSTAFSFAYDASETYAPVRMALDVMPTIEIAVSASGPIAAFESLFGFTEIDVGGEVTLSEQIAIDFRDPDDDGRITEEEWTHTAVLDLTDIAYDEGNLVDAALALEALPVAEGAAPLIPEASGPDTHYKVLQAITTHLEELPPADRKRLEIWGYRNVWHRFHPSEANMYVPVSINSMAIVNYIFKTCYLTQRDASFPSYEHEGPFSELVQRILVEQFKMLRTALGPEFWYQHDTPRLRATKGILFMRSMTFDELHASARSLRETVGRI